MQNYWQPAANQPQQQQFYNENQFTHLGQPAPPSRQQQDSYLFNAHHQQEQQQKHQYSTNQVQYQHQTNVNPIQYQECVKHQDAIPMLVGQVGQVDQVVQASTKQRAHQMLEYQPSEQATLRTTTTGNFYLEQQEKTCNLQNQQQPQIPQMQHQTVIEQPTVITSPGWSSSTNLSDLQPAQQAISAERSPNSSSHSNPSHHLKSSFQSRNLPHHSHHLHSQQMKPTTRQHDLISSNTSKSYHNSNHHHLMSLKSHHSAHHDDVAIIRARILKEFADITPEEQSKFATSSGPNSPAAAATVGQQQHRVRVASISNHSNASLSPKSPLGASVGSPLSPGQASVRSRLSSRSNSFSVPTAGRVHSSIDRLTKQQQQQQQIGAGTEDVSTWTSATAAAIAQSRNPFQNSQQAFQCMNINLEQYISKRNERERSRVRNVNDAFEHLKLSLPLEVDRLGKRMSKVEILRSAIGYIRNLEGILGSRELSLKPNHQNDSSISTSSNSSTRSTSSTSSNNNHNNIDNTSSGNSNDYDSFNMMQNCNISSTTYSVGSNKTKSNSSNNERSDHDLNNLNNTTSNNNNDTNININYINQNDNHTKSYYMNNYMRDNINYNNNEKKGFVTEDTTTTKQSSFVLKNATSNKQLTNGSLDAQIRTSNLNEAQHLDMPMEDMNWFNYDATNCLAQVKQQQQQLMTANSSEGSYVQSSNGFECGFDFNNNNNDEDNNYYNIETRNYTELGSPSWNQQNENQDQNHNQQQQQGEH